MIYYGRENLQLFCFEQSQRIWMKLSVKRVVSGPSVFYEAYVAVTMWYHV